jgi:predicted PurR-regulated permease PerM
MARQHTDDEAANPLADVGEDAPNDTRPLEAPTPAPPARVQPVPVPRWVQLVLLPLAIVGAFKLLSAAGPVLMLFIIAGLIALLLNPLVALLQRARIPRGAAVAVVMVGVLAFLTGCGFLLSTPISDQASSFQRDVPGYIHDANTSLANLQAWLDRKGFNVQVKQEGETALQTIGERITGGAGSVVSFTRDAVQQAVEAGLALILIIVLSVYMLIYGDRIGAVARAVVPPGDGTPDDDFPTRIQASLFGYVRGQVLFSLIMGTSAGLMLWILGSLGIFPEGKAYAIAFGAWYGFAELIPYVGPAVGGFPPVIIAALSGNPIDAVWLIIAFTVLQQLEGHVVAPQVFGQALRINPLLVIFALLLGGQLAGLLGAFIALPIAAILRETIVYLRRPRSPWSDAPSAACSFRAGRTSAPRAAPSSRTAMARPRRPPRHPDDSADGRPSRQALRRPGGAQQRLVQRRGRRAARDHRPQRRGQDDAAADPRRRPGRGQRGRHGAPLRLGSAARRGLLQAHGAREPGAVRAARACAGRRRGPHARADRALARR